MADRSKLVHETQSIARAEVMVCEKTAHILSKTAMEIQQQCHVKIDEMVVKFQPMETRGPEPEVHCVIVAARVEDADPT